MSKILYVECNSGISGDMTVASLIDLGVNEKKLIDTLKTLPIDGYSIEISRVKKSGIDCCDFNVILEKEIDNHDHDMEYLHGKNEENISHHDQEDEHHTHYHDDHQSQEHHHHHEHRGLNEILSIINSSKLTENARKIAIDTFQILAEAEAKAHGTTINEVHFHEVGAIDSIIDIAAVAICIDELGITDVIFSKLCEGTGTIRCQHGVLSIPVPAVANILSMHDIPVQIMDIHGEFVTPTGAAIVAALRTRTHLPESFNIKKIGIGAGKRNYERPSMLRAMLIEESEKSNDIIYKLESNIDDCSGEALGYVMDKLFENGARDVHFFPVYMKKNRPGWQINVICTENDIKILEDIIFSETTTIGIRRQKMERSVLEREIVELNTHYGRIKVKKCRIGDEYRYYPEYESIKEVCKKNEMPYIKVYNEIIQICH